MWESMLKGKSKALEAFKRLKLLVESEKTQRIKCLWIDNGGEFNSKEFSTFCIDSGIKSNSLLPTLL